MSLIPEQSALPGVFVKTFGCQMNEYDSEKILRLLEDTYQPVSSAEEAQLVIVNTCSVREKAANKVYSLLGTYRELKRRNPQLVVGVGGCVAQQEGEQIIRRSPIVDFVVGTHNLSLIPSLVRSIKDGLEPQVAVDYREEWDDVEDPTPGVRSIPGSTSQWASPVRALVAVQRGCNRRCSFCVVPMTRGPELSRGPDEILREIELSVRAGAREVMLLGQTVNSWGRDLKPRLRFSELVKLVAQVSGVKRIRFTSPHPADVRPDFVRLYGQIPELCPHIHLPLQSGCDRVLKLMRRGYTAARYLEIVAELRRVCPEIAFSTDIIVGFPTETQEDFVQTLEMLKRVRYNSAYSFVYSERPSTLAAEMFRTEDLVESGLAAKRLSQLQAEQNQIGAELNSEKLGSTVEVLVEGQKKTVTSQMRGRTPDNVIVELGSEGCQPGEIVRAVIERASPHGLFGRIVEKEV